MSNPMHVNGAPVPFDEGRFCKVDKYTFNLCTECSDQLDESCDGFSTSHGTCNQCLNTYDEDE